MLNRTDDAEDDGDKDKDPEDDDDDDKDKPVETGDKEKDDDKEQDPVKLTEDLKTKEKELAEAKRNYRAAQEARHTEALKEATNDLSKNALGKTGHIAGQITETRNTIKDHRAAIRDILEKTTEKVSTSLVDSLAAHTKQGKSLPDPGSSDKAEGNHPTPLADYFTSIHLSVSQTSDHSKTETSTTSYSASVEATTGMFSGAARMDHSDARATADKDLASCEVDISFDVMRVDIYRPWLFAELFNDLDLRPGPDVKLVFLHPSIFTSILTEYRISPGPVQLKDFIKGKGEDGKKEAEIDSCSFPMYPTGMVHAP